MQISDVNEEGGGVECGDAGFDGAEGCVFERVRCGCGIVTFLSSNGKSYRGKVTSSY